MSYSISVPTCRMEDFDAAVDAAIDAYNWAGTNPDGELPARNAAEAMKIIVGKGLIANPGGWLSANISGHGNPNRDNTGTGYVRDCMTIGFQQQPAPESA